MALPLPRIMKSSSSSQRRRSHTSKFTVSAAKWLMPASNLFRPVARRRFFRTKNCISISRILRRNTSRCWWTAGHLFRCKRPVAPMSSAWARCLQRTSRSSFTVVKAAVRASPPSQSATKESRFTVLSSHWTREKWRRSQLRWNVPCSMSHRLPHSTSERRFTQSISRERSVTTVLLHCAR